MADWEPEKYIRKLAAIEEWPVNGLLLGLDREDTGHYVLRMYNPASKGSMLADEIAMPPGLARAVAHKILEHLNDEVEL